MTILEPCSTNADFSEYPNLMHIRCSLHLSVTVLPISPVQHTGYSICIRNLKSSIVLDRSQHLSNIWGQLENGSYPILEVFQFFLMSHYNRELQQLSFSPPTEIILKLSSSTPRLPEWIVILPYIQWHRTLEIHTCKNFLKSKNLTLVCVLC